MICYNFFYNQPVYKQQSRALQIAKQLSGLKPLSLSNNKTTDQRKIELLPCNKHKLAVKPTIDQNSTVSKTFLGNFKIADYKCRF